MIMNVRIIINANNVILSEEIKKIYISNREYRVNHFYVCKLNTTVVELYFELTFFLFSLVI